MDKQNIRRRFPVDVDNHLMAMSNNDDTMEMMEKIIDDNGDKKFDRSSSIINKKTKNAHQKNKNKLISIIKIFLILLITILLIIFVAIPILYRSSSTFQHMTVYMNFVNFHYFYNLSDPTIFGLKCAKSFRIESNNDIVLGAWHILPNEEQCSEQKLNNAFNDDKLVFLYSHGNSGTRSSSHRVGLLKKLSNQLDVHVVTFDYRSYGDSTNVLATPTGLANDTRHVYQWLLQQNVSPKRIVVWGHSLGTAVTVLFLSKLPYEIYPIAGVLEAPFTSIYEATEKYPLTKIYRVLPYFKYFFLDPLSQNQQTNFNSSALLYSIRCPLLIMHAKDDKILPFEIGEKLFKQAKELQPKNVAHLTRFISFPYENGYGHKKIHLDPKLIDIVKDFLVSIKFNNNSLK